LQGIGNASAAKAARESGGLGLNRRFAPPGARHISSPWRWKPWMRILSDLANFYLWTS